MDDQHGKTIAWLAGMIDADGSIGLHKQPYKCRVHYVPSITLVTSCKRTTEYLQTVFANLFVGVNITERHPKNEGWNIVWVFAVRGMKRCEKLLSIISDCLITKSDEATMLTEFIASRKRHTKRAAYTSEELAFVEAIKQRKHNRNLRGRMLNAQASDVMAQSLGKPSEDTDS